MSQRQSGTVKWFNNAKGIGFIKPASGADVFVHYSAIPGEGSKRLKQGRPVTYIHGDGEKGPLAFDVTQE